MSTIDLADKLGVKPPTVSNMVARLAEKGYLVYERYRGMKLTDQGMKADALRDSSARDNLRFPGYARNRQQDRPRRRRRNRAPSSPSHHLKV